MKEERDGGSGRRKGGWAGSGEPSFLRQVPARLPGPSRGFQWHKDNEDWEKDRERTPSPPTQPTIPTDGSPSF